MLDKVCIWLVAVSKHFVATETKAGYGAKNLLVAVHPP